MRTTVFLTLAVVLAFCVAFAIQPAKADVELIGDERTATFNASITGDGASITSSATGKRQVIQAMTLRSDTAGVVELRDGTDSGALLCAVYLAQNTNLTLGSDELGEGIKSTAGNAINAKLANATLTAVLRVRQE